MKRNDFLNATRAIKKGAIVVYPTDTLYALGADIFNEDAVEKVFRIKKRPFNSPLPVAISNFEGIDKIGYINNVGERVAKRFLPGPLTLILYKKEIVPDIITSGLDKIAVRIPKNDIALELLKQCGPLTVTSANIHNEKTPYVINDIMMQFRTKVSVYLEYGRLQSKPSTIVDVTSRKPVIVRKGSITQEEILDAI